MPKDNSNFFKKKKIWSEVKDELLGCYMVPYFTKILSMGNPILYVDCFAGKGKFDDGKPGSPLTALQSLDSSIAMYRGSRMPEVNMKFIELNHHQDLESNIPNRHRGRCEVIGGKFEDNISPLLQKAMSANRQLNVFLYVDP
jgi:three-Cys-motif partner protein